MPSAKLRSLSTQLILSFTALVVLTALAVGLPAIWLIRSQMEAQAWAQVSQGVQAAAALYAAQQGELAGLATLTAERPSLRALLDQSQEAALRDYLDTLRAGAGLDLVAVCRASGDLITAAGGLDDAAAPPICQTPAGSVTVTTVGSDTPAVWLLAGQGIAAGEGSSVVVGRRLNGAYAEQMRAQTGLDYTLLVGETRAATTLDGDEPRAVAAGEGRATFFWAGQPFYAYRTILAAPAGAPPVRAEVALAVANVAATQQRLLRVLLASIGVAAALGLVLAVLLARRIGRPLADLARAAAAMSGGDFSQALVLDANVREVALVGQALESARSDLQRTLVELRREKAWTDHLLDAIVEGIVTLDHQGRVTFFSHGAERITGWSRDQVTGHSCDEVFHTVSPEPPFSAQIPLPGSRRKVQIQLPDGRQMVLAVSGAQLLPPEAGDARVALVFRDISEEEAVHRLTSHFLANVSHEFRTPLSAVAASVELLIDQAAELSPDELQSLLTSLHLGVLNLQTLVDNLLESASIEAGRFRVYPRPTPLHEIIAEAVATMQPLLDRHGQRLVVELPAAMPAVLADPRRIVQVLTNLLSNASKYGPVDAEITLAVSAADGWARVSVADQGPGIPAEQRRDLFRRFVTPAGQDSRSQAGFGLGLSVVKAITEAHGGQVGVDDRLDGATVFWFTLRCADWT